MAGLCYLVEGRLIIVCVPRDIFKLDKLMEETNLSMDSTVQDVGNPYIKRSEENTTCLDLSPLLLERGIHDSVTALPPSIPL